jgi:hypothetical protein
MKLNEYFAKKDELLSLWNPLIAKLFLIVIFGKGPFIFVVLQFYIKGCYTSLQYI